MLKVAPNVQTQLTLQLAPAIELTDEQFFDFCQQNRELRIERTPGGAIVIMAPVGGQTGHRNLKIGRYLDEWAEEDGTGIAFDSSTGFILPNTATRSPDAAWVRLERLQALTAEEKQKFLPLCPDFVVELRSPSDSLKDLLAKMEEYVENGAELGWLIDPQNRQVFVYRPHASPQQLLNPTELSGDPILPSFKLPLQAIWDPGF